MQQAPGANPLPHAGQALPRRLDLEDVHAYELGAEFPRRLRHSADQSLSEGDNVAMALHPITGGDARQDMPIARHLPSTSTVGTCNRHL